MSYAILQMKLKNVSSVKMLYGPLESTYTHQL